MKPTWQEVNAAVLAALGEVTRPAGSNGRVANGHDPVFVDRLLSLRQAEAFVDGRGEVRVLAGTVITPLARDFLKGRGVAVRVVSERDATRFGSTRAGEWGFAVESRSGQVEAVRRAFLMDQHWSEVGDNSTAAAHWVAEGDGRGALVLTDEASVATWRAGRVAGIRAATVTDPDSVSRATRHLGANVVAVEVAGRSIHLLKQVAERFRLGGAPTMPGTLDDFHAFGGPTR